MADAIPEVEQVGAATLVGTASAVVHLFTGSYADLAILAVSSILSRPQDEQTLIAAHWAVQGSDVIAWGRSAFYVGLAFSQRFRPRPLVLRPDYFTRVGCTCKGTLDSIPVMQNGLVDVPCATAANSFDSCVVATTALPTTAGVASTTPSANGATSTSGTSNSATTNLLSSAAALFAPVPVTFSPEGMVGRGTITVTLSSGSANVDVRPLPTCAQSPLICAFVNP